LISAGAADPAAMGKLTTLIAYPGFYNGGGSRGGSGPARGCGDGSPSVGSRGKAPVGGLGDAPQKLKQNVKLVYNF